MALLTYIALRPRPAGIQISVQLPLAAEEVIAAWMKRIPCSPSVAVG